MDALMPVIIAIIVGAFALVSKRTKEQAAQQQSSKTPPSEQMSKEFTQTQEKMRNEQREERALREVTEQYEGWDTGNKIDVVEKPRRRQQRKKSTNSGFTFNKSDLARGIVLSEILGQPRARRPHQGIIKYQTNTQKTKR